MEGLVPGRIVYFVFDEYSAKQVEEERRDLACGGNTVKAGDIYPAMVVKVWDPSVNLKVMLDGPDTFWATSVVYDQTKSNRSWHWMYDGQATRGNSK